jgi:hypothetical protein
MIEKDKVIEMHKQQKKATILFGKKTKKKFYQKEHASL